MGMFRDMKDAFGVIRSDELKELKRKADAQPKPSMMEGIRAANGAGAVVVTGSEMHSS